jgi:hypothetical protein
MSRPPSTKARHKEKTAVSDGSRGRPKQQREVRLKPKRRSVFRGTFARRRRADTNPPTRRALGGASYLEPVKTRAPTTKRKAPQPRPLAAAGLPKTRRIRRTLYTIGHSTRSADEFIDILRAFAVTRLIDIRSIPRSRANPQFNLDVLPAVLGGAGVAYVHLASLGGRRSKSTDVEESANAGWQKQPFHNYADYAETAPFREGLRELLEMAARETSAIMCAEAVWWRCHRRIVADHVLAHRVPVAHIFTREKSEPASLTPFAVIKGRARVSYPVNPSSGEPSTA